MDFRNIIHYDYFTFTDGTMAMQFSFRLMQLELTAVSLLLICISLTSGAKLDHSRMKRQTVDNRSNGQSGGMSDSPAIM